MTTSGWKLKLVTPPSVEPITLAEAKSHLRVTISDDDDLIRSYIKSAREAAENYTRRAFVSQVWDLGIDGFWGGEIMLPKAPLISVLSITYTDDDDVEQTLPTTDYSVDDFSEPGVIYRARAASWPALTGPGTRGRVRFMAGYRGEGSPGDGAENVPEGIKQAIRLYVGHLYENREAVNVGNIVAEMPLAYDSLLHPFRVYGWGEW